MADGVFDNLLSACVGLHIRPASPRQTRFSHVIFDIPIPITCRVSFRGSPDDDDELIGFKLSSHVRDLP